MVTEKWLIDANALKSKAWPDEVTGEGFVYVEDIDNAPTVDAVEVVHGRYIQKPYDEWWAPYYVCLECGTQMMVADEEGRIIKPNFCPNCGAKMDSKGG